MNPWIWLIIVVSCAFLSMIVGEFIVQWQSVDPIYESQQRLTWNAIYVGTNIVLIFISSVGFMKLVNLLKEESDAKHHSERQELTSKQLLSPGISKPLS